MFKIESFTWIARSKIVLDALIYQIDQIAVLTDQNRYEQITLKENNNKLAMEVYIYIFLIIE